MKYDSQYQKNAHTIKQFQTVMFILSTVKPVCNDHLYNEFYYLWFIEQCVLMKTGGTNLLVLTIAALGREVSY